MKTTMVIQDGRMQLVLTPESEAERNMVDVFRGDNCSVWSMKANFGATRGGYLNDFKDAMSLIIGLDIHNDAANRVVQEKERAGIPMPPEPQVSADLLVKLAQYLSDHDDGQLEPPFTEHDISTLGKWLRWQVEYTDVRFR